MKASSVVTTARDHISARLPGEVLILNLRTGQHHSLGEVAARVWKLLADRITVAEVRDAIARTYAIEPEVCERDVVNLLEHLAERGLIEVERDGSG